MYDTIYLKPSIIRKLILSKDKTYIIDGLLHSIKILLDSGELKKGYYIEYRINLSIEDESGKINHYVGFGEKYNIQTGKHIFTREVEFEPLFIFNNSKKLSELVSKYKDVKVELDKFLMNVYKTVYKTQPPIEIALSMTPTDLVCRDKKTILGTCIAGPDKDRTCIYCNKSTENLKSRYV